MDSEKEKVFLIDQRLHRNLIGQKGETIKKVAEKFQNVQIQFPLPGEKSDSVRVKGPNESVEACGKHLMTMANTMKQDNYQLKVPLARQYHKFIVGRSGATINKIRGETNTSIDLPTESQKSEDILISGRKEDCEKAEEKILKIKRELEMRDLEKNMGTEEEKIIRIDQRLHRNLIGQKGETIRKVWDKFPSVQIKFPDAGENSDSVRIRGPKERVEACGKHLMTMANTMKQDNHQLKVSLKRQYHRVIVGKNGATINKIREETNTFIELPAEGQNSENILITGKKEDCEKAKEKILKIKEELEQRELDKKMGNEKGGVFQIPQRFHRNLIGPRGETIQQVGDKFQNVLIQFPDAGEKSDNVRIEGPKESVEACGKHLLDMASKMKNNHQLKVSLKRQYHRVIVGRNGATINKIRDETNTFIELPTEGQNSEDILITGRKEDCEKAKEMILKIKEELEVRERNGKMENEEEKVIRIDQKIHRNLIGQKGETIKEVWDKFRDVQISFPDAGEKSDSVRVKGPKESVEACGKHLMTMANKMKQDNHQLKVSLMRQYHKFIIGRNGATINKIREETNTFIELPSEGQDSEDILITGRKEDCEKAKEMILKIKEELKLRDLDRKLENEKVFQIDQRFHRNLIGQKGETIQEVAEKFPSVQIQFPDPGEKSDCVRISGSKESVEACGKHLVTMANKMKKDNHQLKVSLKRQYHRVIVGRNGATINKIRDETNTFIELPAEGETSEDILITGKKEDCEKAKEMILKIKEELEDGTEIDVIIPSKFHNSMIGAGGKQVQTISEQCGGVSIQFPPPNAKSDKVTIRGKKDDIQKAKRILVDLTKEKQATECTAEFRAKPEIHRFLIGRNGVNVRKICEKTNTNISFPTEQDANNEVITIVGKEQGIKEAKHELELIMKNLESAIERTINVDPKHHRYFVSRRGEILRQISDKFGGVTISFPRQGVDSSQVVLKGAEDCLDGACNRIQEIVKDLESLDTIEVDIPHVHHRILMGARGLKIQAISTDHDVQIRFPDRDLVVDDSIQVINGQICPQDKVTIQGKQANCLAAKKALLAAIPVSDDVEVPFIYHRFLIGTKGEAINQLSSEFDVQIKVPPMSEQKDIISVHGAVTCVAEAKAAILKKVENFKDEEEDRVSKNFSVKVPVALDHIAKIIGKKGSVISKIQEKYRVNVQFPRPGDYEDDFITITGYEENCNAAQQAILDITDNLDTRIEDVMDIDSRIHSRLIGTRGQAIRKVMEAYKVDIKFPRGDDNPDQVVIVGHQEDVNECKEHLNDLMEEFMQDLSEREELNRYAPASNGSHNAQKERESTRSEQVKEAPLTQRLPQLHSSEDFPSMGEPA